MTFIAILAAVGCQLFQVTGQVFLKHAMLAVDAAPRVWRRVALFMVAGLTFLTFWFLMWIGLMQSWNLSAIYPFEGLCPVLMVLGARVCLHEKLGAAGWLGVTLIAAGVMLVAGS